MTDEQTAAAIVAEHRKSQHLTITEAYKELRAAIVRALQAARKEGGKQVVDEAERVSQILQSANTANADSEAKARFEVDRFAFACSGSVVGSTLTDYQKHALFHQFKNVFDSHESALQAARESAIDTHANAAVLRMCHEARMMNGIVDYSDPNATGVVRKVLGTLPITKDGCVVGRGIHSQYHIGTVSGVPFLRLEGSTVDHSQWYSTREAAEAAKEGKA